MVFKRFYIQLIVRISLMFLSGYLFLLFVDKPNFLYLKILFIVLTIFQITSLISYFNRINKKLALFFESIKTEDYTVVFSAQNDEFKELNHQLDLLSKHFKEVVLKREEKDEYFKAVIEHIGIGILAFDARGSIRFINTEALKIFDLNQLKNLSALDYIQKDLSLTFKNLSPGNQHLIEYRRRNETFQLSAKVTRYKISDEELNLVSLQNIKSELDIKETETWQKMIRILTHEIMNSVSPITSLANSLSKIIQKKSDLSEHSISKIEKGLTTIKNRGEGMMDFVHKYRNLTIIPLPQFSSVNLYDLMTELAILFEENFKSGQIDFKWKVAPTNLQLNADKEQLEQVLINLIKNAIWAVQDTTSKEISVSIFNINQKIQIEVSDSGIGLKPSDLDQIFIPFYTTRQEGSGIGLSLSRQIMLMHGGSISATANADQGSMFVLVFNE